MLRFLHAIAILPLTVSAALPAQVHAPAQEPDGGAPEAAPGASILVELVERAGGREAWAKLPGLRYDMLESVRSPVDRRTDTWRLQYRIPYLCHFDPNGDGFMKSETVRSDLSGPEYRRIILHEGTAWAEKQGNYVRLKQAASDIETQVRREHFLAGFPFTLEQYGAEAEYVRKERRAKRVLEVYTLRLARPIILGRFEELDEFLMFVDAAEKRVVQLKWTYNGMDNWNRSKAYTWGHVDFEGAREVGGVTLAYKRSYWTDERTRVIGWEIEDLRAEAIPPAALRRPWFSGTVYDTPDRADSWDPPKKEDATVGAGAGGSNG